MASHSNLLNWGFVAPAAATTLLRNLVETGIAVYKWATKWRTGTRQEDVEMGDLPPPQSVEEIAGWARGSPGRGTGALPASLSPVSPRLMPPSERRPRTRPIQVPLRQKCCRISAEQRQARATRTTSGKSRAFIEYGSPQVFNHGVELGLVTKSCSMRLEYHCLKKHTIQYLCRPNCANIWYELPHPMLPFPIWLLLPSP